MLEGGGGVGMGWRVMWGWVGMVRECVFVVCVCVCVGGGGGGGGGGYFAVCFCSMTITRC